LKPLIYVDGGAGTTGLEIVARLRERDDLSLVLLSDSKRKDFEARSQALNEADIAILCLPDEAAREAVAAIRNQSTRVLDASSVHRISANWTYGFPELEANRREAIAEAGRVSNPGCYATGFLGLVRPLVRAGVIPPAFPLSVNAISGYSGGGKMMIAEFENADSHHYTKGVARTYALTLAHKHVPEMQLHAGLAHPPVFAPTVARFYRGMIVEVPLQLWALPGSPSILAIHRILSDAYADHPLMEVAELESSRAMAALDPELLSRSDRMKLFVFGNEKREQVRLVAVLDNLGKGAGGAAVQNLNVMLGMPETRGLR